jgi:hypothetical protein
MVIYFQFFTGRSLFLQLLISSFLLKILNVFSCHQFKFQVIVIHLSGFYCGKCEQVQSLFQFNGAQIIDIVPMVPLTPG